MSMRHRSSNPQPHPAVLTPNPILQSCPTFSLCDKPPTPSCSPAPPSVCVTNPQPHPAVLPHLQSVWQTPNPILQSCPTFNALRYRRSAWHRSSNPQPHPAVLPHLRRLETPDMAQSGGCPQEALGTGWDTAADCGLCPTHQTEDLAWLGTQKKKKLTLLHVLQTGPAPSPPPPLCHSACPCLSAPHHLLSMDNKCSMAGCLCLLSFPATC